MAYTTIDDPSAYFQTALYSSTGGGGSITVTNDGNSDLQPDWIWIKVRDGANDHNTFDSSRSNFGERLFPNLTSQSDSVVSVSASSDGFATGTGYGDINNTSGANNYVAWQWKANGGTTSSNTDGSITSTVQANTTAGFSIVTYTGNASDGSTVGHGLGAVPEFIIIKSRSATTGWSVNDSANGIGNGYLQLQSTAAFASASNNVKAASSTTFTLGVDSWVNASGGNFVVYLFKSIQGYSKFGSYTGNGSTDGPFVYLGFKPAWVMIKKSSGTDSWIILDDKRTDTGGKTNPVDKVLYPDSSTTEYDESLGVDFLSNGFKYRDTGGWGGGTSGATYIYMAFAEQPFVSSEGVPTTAR